MFEPDLAFLLQRASESPFGIAVRTNNPQLLRNKLYAERKKHGLFQHLTFKQPPKNPEGELWIVNREGPNGTS